MKLPIVVDYLMERGRSFQSLGATFGKALSPKDLVLVFGTTRRWVSKERKEQELVRLVRKEEM